MDPGSACMTKVYRCALTCVKPVSARVLDAIVPLTRLRFRSGQEAQSRERWGRRVRSARVLDAIVPLTRLRFRSGQEAQSRKRWGRRVRSARDLDAIVPLTRLRFLRPQSARVLDAIGALTRLRFRSGQEAQSRERWGPGCQTKRLESWHSRTYLTTASRSASARTSRMLPPRVHHLRRDC